MSTYDRIIRYVQECDYSPSVREIAAGVGRAPSTVHTHLNRMERQGLISRHGAERRIALKDAA